MKEHRSHMYKGQTHYQQQAHTNTNTDETHLVQHLMVKFVLVMFLLIVIAAAFGIFPSTEMIVGMFLLVFIWTPRDRAFAFDFVPFAVLLFTYEKLRGFANDLSMSDINITNLIDWEKGLFGGTVPSHYLQTHLSGHFYTPALDFLASGLYLSHFMVPVIIALLLWQRDRPRYWAFALALVSLSFAAFATYIIFPAAPPWWATMYGYLTDQPVTLDPFIISADVVRSGPNPVAAMPSLHTAYPTFIALISVSIWGRKLLPMFLLPVAVASATVYLGHHYVIDALAGATYATIIFLTVYPWAARVTASHAVFARRGTPTTRAS